MTAPIDLGEYRKWHTEDELSGLCVVCDHAFPCDAIQLADEVERLREALEDVVDMQQYEPSGLIHEAARVARAALEGRSSLREVMECYEYDQYEVK